MRENQYIFVRDDFKQSVFNLNHICTIVVGEESLNKMLITIVVSGGSSVVFQYKNKKERDEIYARLLKEIGPVISISNE